MNNIAPGWYDDGSGHQRWWNGAAWTQQLKAGEQQQPHEIQNQHVRSVVDMARERGAEYGFESRIEGRNALVYVFADRIEWEKPRLLGRGHAGTEVIPIRQISAVTTQRESFLWSVLVVRVSGGQFGFRASHAIVEAVRQVINKHVLAGGQPAVAAEPAAPSRVDELVKLADLFKQGLLTEAEFTAAKANLIG